MAHNWVGMTPDSPIPSFAVIGESHADEGSITYVGRSSHEGGMFPARIDSKKHCAYVSWAGCQIKKTHYEILIGDNYKFIKYSADGIPLCAVRAGNTAEGDPLWVGRGVVKGRLIIGKIHPIHQCLFVPYDGEEHCLDSYEVLVRYETIKQPRLLHPKEASSAPQPTTCSTPMKTTVAMAPSSAFDQCSMNELWSDDPDKCRFPVDATKEVVNELPQPPSEEAPKIPEEESEEEEKVTDGEAVDSNSYSDPRPRGDINEPLQPPTSTTEKTNLDNDAETGIVASSSEDKPVLDVGNEPSNEPIWMSSAFDNIPPNAIVVGKDTDESDIYVGRAQSLPAKIVPKRKEVYITLNGKEVSIKSEFEFLVGDGYTWEKGVKSGNNIPIGAVSTGISEKGPVYIGRGRYLEIMTPGSVYQGDYSVYIPYHGLEHKLTDNYEVLVKKLSYTE